MVATSDTLATLRKSEIFKHFEVYFYLCYFVCIIQLLNSLNVIFTQTKTWHLKSLVQKKTFQTSIHFSCNVSLQSITVLPHGRTKAHQFFQSPPCCTLLPIRTVAICNTTLWQHGHSIAFNTPFACACIIELRQKNLAHDPKNATRSLMVVQTQQPARQARAISTISIYTFIAAPLFLSPGANSAPGWHLK